MTDARTLAVNCTAKLYTFRKTRDGVFAQFVIHPNEVPEKLQRDPIGTSYMMALVEVDDSTGQPKEGGGATERLSTIQPETTPRPLEPGGGVKSYAQECGRMCNDPRFQGFVRERDGSHVSTPLNWAENPAQATKKYIYWWCGVDSRTRLIAGTEPGDEWNKLVAEYEAEKVMA